jgi:hypothetical protein
MIASRTTSHLSRSPKPRTFHDITLASPVIFSSEMLHIGRPTRVLFFRTGGMPVNIYKGKRTWAPTSALSHRLILPRADARRALPASTTRGRTTSAPRLGRAWQPRQMRCRSRGRRAGQPAGCAAAPHACRG